jgi:Conserved TM helix
VNVSADIGDSVQQFSDEFFAWLPRLIGAIVILLIAYLIAKAVRKLIERALPKTGIDRAVHSGRYGEYVSRYASGFSPTAVIAAIAFWFIFLTGVLLALSTLGIEALDNAIAAVVGYLPNVVVAILILVVAIALAGVVGGAIAKLMGDTALGKIAATVLPVLIMTVAVFMALVQLRIATQIVVGMFYIVLGGIVLAAALAFGLGGRNAAQRLLDGAYEKGQAAMPQVRAEAALAKERAAERTEEVRRSVEPPADEPPAGEPPGGPPPRPATG